MAENQEQIESRLCGYVDDTLDPAEQAEIEVHLDAHPQHRQLLAQLRQMRDAIRALPRESAPAELTESFSGQLERSVLLDGIGDRPVPARMRISRLPQLAAVAAIIVLAAGLGLTVYFASLYNKPQPQVAQQTPPAAAPGISPEGTPDTLADRSAKSIDGPGGSGEQTRVAAAAPAEGPSAIRALPLHPPQAPAPPDAPAPPGAVGVANDDDALQTALLAKSVLSNEQVKALLGHADQADKAGGESRPTVVMVVSTANLDATTRQVGSYLQTNNADWQPAPSADHLAMYRQVAFGNVAVRTLGGPGNPSGNGVPAGGGSELDGSRGNENASPTTLPQTQPVDMAHAARANPGTTAGDTQKDLQQRSQRGGADGNSGNPVNKPLDNVQQNQLADAENHCYVVRNLSFQQATQLSDMLRQAVRGTQAPLFADSSAGEEAKADMARMAVLPPAPAADMAAAPATQPATQPQQPQQAYIAEASHGTNETRAAQRDISQDANPQTNPAAAAAAAPVPRNIVPINNQSLLGSSPVDLVILIKDATPTTMPATAPATEPATRPAE